MEGYKINIEEAALKNKNFRKVLYTSNQLQVVLMTLLPSTEIASETHPGNDQFFRFEEGRGKCIINGTEYQIQDGDAVVIPAGSKHNIVNTDAEKDLIMYTIYSPPKHKDGLVNKTKEDADNNDIEYDGKTTE